MPITAGDIVFRLSGGASNADPNASLGGAKSSQSVVDATLHNLFDQVSGDEGAAGDVEYRCVYIHNAHATLTLQAAKVWIQSNTPSSDTAAQIGLGAAAVGAAESAVANENTAPAGVTFDDAAGEGAALVIGDIPAGSHKALWVKRTVSAGAAAYNNDGVVLRVKGDTAA